MKVTQLAVCTAFLLFTFFMTSCTKDLVPHTEMVGKWECINIETQGTNPPLKGITFDFNQDSTYHYYSKDNNTGQKGTWYTLGNILYTTPTGGTKMGVKLEKSGKDTLRFYQNRAGSPEVWTIIRR